ncbi:IS3 family transposase [Coraliomargarita sp. W4R53]
MDRIYLTEPTDGSRRMLDELQLLVQAGGDRVRRLTRIMGIQPIYPKPHLSTLGKSPQSSILIFLEALRSTAVTMYRARTLPIAH